MTRDIEISLLTKLQKQLEINQVYFETLMALVAHDDSETKIDFQAMARNAIAKGKEIRDRRGE